MYTCFVSMNWTSVARFSLLVNILQSFLDDAMRADYLFILYESIAFYTFVVYLLDFKR